MHLVCFLLSSPLAALVGVAITASLGRWQLGRAAEKLAYEQTLTSRCALPPGLGWGELAKADAAGAVEDLRHRTVELEGLWLPEHTIYLDNRKCRRPRLFSSSPPAIARDQRRGAGTARLGATQFSGSNPGA